jgi:hypothetical protein
MPKQSVVARWVLTAVMAGASTYAMAQNTQADGGAAARAGAIAHTQNVGQASKWDPTRT